MTAAARPVSGEQFEIRHDRFRAQIGQVAAVLRSFTADGAACTESWPDDWVAPMGCGLVLMPWPNRVADARWTHQGSVQKLDITEPSRGHASHGLLRNTAYALQYEDRSSVTLAASIYPQHGYPFSLDTTVTYALSDSGLTVTHTVANVGTAAAPFGVGAHPYLRVGEVPADELTVTVAGRTRAVVDDRLIPASMEPVAGTEFDLRSGVTVGSLDLDTAFTDLEPADGRVEHRLAAPDGRALVLWADEVFGWVQLFTPSIFPGPGLPGQRQAIAIEPMTCAADALNNGHGLLTVVPGETWSASWGLRPEGF